MIDPKDIEKVINRSDIVIQCLLKWGITFKIPMIRCKVAALGYQFLWNDLSREETAKGLSEIGFDNLTLIQIMEAFVKISNKMAASKERTSLRPRLSSIKRIQWEARIKNNVFRGKF